MQALKIKEEHSNLLAQGLEKSLNIRKFHQHFDVPAHSTLTTHTYTAGDGNHFWVAVKRNRDKVWYICEYAILKQWFPWGEHLSASEHTGPKHNMAFILWYTFKRWLITPHRCASPDGHRDTPGNSLFTHIHLYSLMFEVTFMLGHICATLRSRQAFLWDFCKLKTVKMPPQCKPLRNPPTQDERLCLSLQLTGSHTWVDMDDFLHASGYSQISIFFKDEWVHNDGRDEDVKLGARHHRLRS